MYYYGNNDWRDYQIIKHYGVKGMKWGKRKKITKEEHMQIIKSNPMLATKTGYLDRRPLSKLVATKYINNVQKRRTERTAAYADRMGKINSYKAKNVKDSKIKAYQKASKRRKKEKRKEKVKSIISTSKKKLTAVSSKGKSTAKSLVSKLFSKRR